LTPETRLKFLGTTEERSCEVCVDDLNLNVTLDQFINEFQALSKQRLADVELLPGAERLIKHLNSHKIPICVATSSGEETVKVKTQNHLEVFKLFLNITKGTDVKEGKPAPDIFLLAASRLKIEPENVSRQSHLEHSRSISVSFSQCLVLEDAPNGVQGALSANMQVVMVPADYISDELKAKATLAIKSLENFQPELFGLPPFF
jgi:pseudouridine-5'-monophosphatase